MKKRFLIKDIGTDEFYWSYRGDAGFGALEDARRFDSDAEAIERIETEIAVRTDTGRELQIIEIYAIGE